MTNLENQYEIVPEQNNIPLPNNFNTEIIIAQPMIEGYTLEDDDYKYIIHYTRDIEIDEIDDADFNDEKQKIVLKNDFEKLDFRKKLKIMEDEKNLSLFFINELNIKFDEIYEKNQIVRHLAVILQNRKYPHLTSIDEVVIKYFNNKVNDIISNNMIDVLMNIIENNCSRKSIQTCKELIKGINDAQANYFFDLGGKKLDNFEKQKNEAIYYSIKKVKDILDLFTKNRWFEPFDLLIHDVNDIIESISKYPDTKTEIDKVLKSLVEYYIFVIKNKNVIYSFTENFCESSTIFKLLSAYHSSNEFKYKVFNEVDNLKFFPYDTVKKLLSDNHQFNGLKERCIDYVCEAYQNINHQNSKPIIRDCIQEFIIDEIQDTELRKKAYKNFLAVIPEEDKKKEFMSTIVNKLLESSRNLTTKKECIVCKNQKTVDSLNLALKIYRLIRNNQDQDFIDKKNELVAMLKEKIYADDTQISKEKRNEVFDLFIENAITNGKKDIKKLKKLTKDCIDQLVNTQKEQNCHCAFCKSNTDNYTVNNSIRIIELFSRIDNNIAKEFSDIHDFLDGNISKFIFHRTYGIDRTMREKYFDITTEKMDFDKLVDYSKRIINDSISSKTTTNSVCIFCDDGKNIDKSLDTILNFYTLFSNTSNGDDSEISDIKNNLKEILSYSITDVCNYNEKKSMFGKVSSNLNFEEFTNFVNQIVENILTT
ncbi:hypothetical protein E4O00_05245 [Treponema sp. OMZ 788]|uniref:hypothetical protein n=1 Tax=Treponema sp. OMZ 788 TaxID=2563664 RepID=UPI0020A60C0B|nr:hypothetical protein [Treponema sp. OMZ 788]UTC65517.1 hypothetical protein E4O00_05245 [Treponema sp. OMZ 788]